jgi:uncharacterized protein (TIGR02217 family)
MWGVKKRPTWNTRIQKSVSGVETRVSFASLPRWRWSLSFEFLRQNSTNPEWQYLAQFFTDRRGMWDSFLYSDPTDRTVAAADRTTLGKFGTGDGTTTVFQMARRLYTGASIAEPIYNLQGVPNIYKDNTLQTVGVNYTLSATGLVTFAAAPGVGTIVNFEGSWYWRCRFDQDIADYDNFVSGIWRLGELSFVSILGS